MTEVAVVEIVRIADLAEDAKELGVQKVIPFIGVWIEILTDTSIYYIF